MSQLRKKWGILIAVGGGVFLLDQIAKNLVVTYLNLGETWEAFQIGNILRISRSHNTGAAFGIFPFASTLILILVVITIGAFIALYPSLPSSALLSRISIALILGGALSNAVDRFRFGHVIDYFHVQVTPRMANISNFGDHVITIGVVLLLIDQWMIEKREKTARLAAQEAEAAADLTLEVTSETAEEAAPAAPFDAAVENE